MQHAKLTLSSAPLCYGEKKRNIIAVQHSKPRGTQDTVNSNSGDGSATCRRAKESVK
jgi:hypothetical protein